jgi:hypothetical protein
MMVARRCGDRGTGGIRSLTDQKLRSHVSTASVQLVLEQKDSKQSGAAFPIPTRVPEALIHASVSSTAAWDLRWLRWTLGRFDHLTPAQVDAVHGSNVAGILLAGQSANGPAIPPEPDGCELHDVAQGMAGMVKRSAGWCRWRTGSTQAGGEKP